jgi:hypothetical protein
MKIQAGGDAMGGSDAGGGDAGSGDSGSMGLAGVSGRCESGSDSGGADGVERGKTGNGMVGTGGDDDAVNGGVAGQDNGKRSRSLSSSRSPRSSTSLLHFLVFFAGGGRILGEKGKTLVWGTAVL